jgi:hypothetical protein
MSLRIRRGTDAQRTSLTFDLGELVWTTDSQKLYVGDGITAGGINAMATMAGTGFTFNPTTQRIDFSVPNLNLNTSEVSENIANLYFTDERAQDAVAAALLAGNAYNTGIAFSYNDVDNRITAVATGNQVPSISGNAGKYLTTDGTNIIWHNPPIPGGLSIPSFGGNQGKYLTTDGTNLAWANVAINTLTYSTYNVILDSSGNLTTSGDIKLPYGKDIKRDNGSGTFISVLGGLASINADLTPSLGGNLGLNGYNIGGTGNVNINGNIEATGTLKVHNTQIVGTLDVSTGLGADLTLNGHNIVGSTGTINITGSITGGRITGTSLVSGNLTVNSNSIVVTSGSLYIENNNQQILAFRGVNVDGNVNNTPQVNLYSSRGTTGTPTSSQSGDAVMSLNFGGYNGSNYQQTGAIFNIYSSTANMSDSSPGSELWLVSNDNNGGQNLAKFNMDGVFDAPILKTGAYNGSGSYPVRPVAGMIIFDSSNQHFYGYDGSIWKPLDN